MGYKPKYAASSRKREPDIIRTKPEQEKPAKPPKKEQSRAGRIFQIILTVVLVPVCTFASVKLLGWMLETVGQPKAAVVAKTKDKTILDDFDAYVEQKLSQVDSGLTVNSLGTVELPEPTEEETEPVHEHYTIPDDVLVAPKPDQSCYGTVDSPAEMEPILKQAKWILDGQQTYFQTDQEIYEDSCIRYYLDDSIFAVTWQEVHDDSVYTFSEIKVEDASQFRRHLADGQYGSDTQYLTTEMAETVNAVVASAGDFYRFRNFGAVVYQGQARRVEGTYAETCYIDYNGDMHFTRGGEVLTVQDVQDFVDEHDINFSLAFGPILVDNYELQEHTWYGVGEITEGYARAALCQMDTLHYIVATANTTGVHQSIPTVAQFAKNIAATGCRMAYCLDGGQTATIVMNNDLVNRPVYGQQRKISDIIYFATAVPEGGTDNG
ncbi:MAG: phosphodiester glycosidase family protein [Eubacteriales bacterium]|nr:phosphodiester glycosidase family protein [Eubacteriales bacterium]